MGFFHKRRGSITIFLAIILLPSLTFSGLMVDIANINLSKAIVEGAGELTTNAALANYDTVLKDVYGLFAMSQTADDPAAALQENLEEYFSNTLQASGLINGDDDIELQSELLGELQKLFTETSEVNKNFLNVDYENFTAKYLADSNLAVPQVLKTQIVEFMKYRGPAEVGLSFLDSLSVFKKVNAQSTVASAKVKVDEAVGDLGESCAKFYSAITAYDAAVNNYRIKEAEFRSNLSITNNHIKTANESIVKYLLSPADFSNLAFMNSQTNEVIIDGIKQNVTNYWMTGSNPSTKPITANTYEGLKSEITATMNQPLNANLSLLSGYITDNNISAMNSCFASYREYTSYIFKLFELKSRINSVSYPANPNEDITDEEYIIQMDADKEGVLSIIDSFFSSFVGNSNIVKSNIASYQGILNIQKGAVQFDVEKTTSNIKVLYDAAKTIKDCADTVNTRGANVVTNLEKIETQNNAFKESNDEYGTDASSGGKDDFYATMNSDIERNKALFKKQDLDEILSQVEAGKNFATKVRTYLESFKFYGATFADDSCNTESEATNAARAYESALNADIAIGTTISADYAKSFFNKYNLAIVNIDSVTINSTTIYLKKISEVLSTNAKVVPPFYIYLVSNYGTSKQDDTNKAQDTLTENVKSLNNTGRTDASIDNPPKTYELSYFKHSPSTTDSEKVYDFEKIENNDKKNATSQFSKMQEISNAIFGGLSNLGEGLRDNLLVSEYIFQNFSYATAEKEEGFKKEKYRTLTNVPINELNNKIYGCEIEYIVFGKKGTAEKKILWFTTKEKTGPETNVAIAKQNIFAVRFIFNSIFALTDGTLNSQTLPPAMAIQAATSGIFPYKLAQVVIKLALALTESIIDLDELMLGKKVVLMKTSETWNCSIDGLANKLTEKAAKELTDAVTEKAYAWMGSMQDAIDDGTEWSTTKINNLTRDIGSDISHTITSTLTGAVSTMVQITTDKIETSFISMFTEGVTYTTDSLTKEIDLALDKYISDFSKDEDVKGYLIAQKLTIKSSITDAISSQLETTANKIKASSNDSSVAIDEEMFNNIQTIINKETETFMTNVTQTVASSANTLIINASTKLKDVIKVEGTKLVDGVAEQISSKSTELLNQYFPSSSTTITGMGSESLTGSSAKESIFMFSYKDYLRLFLFLKLSANSDSVMLRTADVIQLNVGSKLEDYAQTKLGRAPETAAHTKGTEFRMNKAFTYVEISADIQVKALLLSKSIFTKGARDATKKPINYWTYHYKTIAGY